MKVLITGAAGQLGAAVAAAAEHSNCAVVGLGQKDLDITDAEAVDEVVGSQSPELIVNCAALTNADQAERELETAFAVNVEGARNLARAANAIDARIVYPSVADVFDGWSGKPYVETDRPHPSSAYGQTKLTGERVTAETAKCHFIVRSSWLYGHKAPGGPETLLRLAAEHGEVVANRDEFGSPTYVSHLAEAIMRLGRFDSYGLHHIAARGSCSRYEFAVELFTQAQVDCRVISAERDEVEAASSLPHTVALESVSPDAIRLPTWQEGITDFLNDRLQ